MVSLAYSTKYLRNNTSYTKVLPAFKHLLTYLIKSTIPWYQNRYEQENYRPVSHTDSNAKILKK